MKLGPYLLGPNDKNQGIYTGDAREFAQAIPDESVDLIFTDPVYDRMDDYLWLAETAARVLKPDGVLLLWSNGRWHYQNALWIGDAQMVYRWTFASISKNVSAPMNGKIIAKTNRLLWFDLGGSRNMRTYLPDGYSSIGGLWDIPKSKHKWGKSARFTSRALACFSDIDATVVDPFTGGATIPAVCKTLGRRWLAFEIDPPTAELARNRVRETQPPLFVPQPTQLELAT